MHSEKKEDKAELERRKTMSGFRGTVGDEEETRGFGLGVAPRDAKPLNKLEMNREKDEFYQSELGDDDIPEEEDEEELMRTRIQKKKDKKRSAIPRQEAFLEFKQEEGKQAESDIIENRKTLKEKKTDIKMASEVCNMTKIEIDKIQIQLEGKKEEKNKALGQVELDDEEEVIDEEEFALIKEMKSHKKSYKENYGKLKSLKTEIRHIQGSIDQVIFIF
jgi:hypothetical protein